MIILPHEVKWSREPTYFSPTPQLIFSGKLGCSEATIPRLMHRHSDRIELVFIAHGKGNYTVDGECYQLTAGEIIIFRKGVPHEEVPVDEGQSAIYTVGLTRVRLRDGILDPFNDSRLPIKFHTGKCFESIRSQFELLAEENQQNVFLYLIDMIVSAYQVNVRFDSNSPELEKYLFGKRICDYIDEYFYTDINLDNIAHSFKMNVFYMSHKFKEFCNTSPKQYLMRRRIGEAQSLLISSDYDIGDIARFVGYINIGSFHRAFKIIVGVTPLTYRKLMKKTVLPVSKSFSKHNECMFTCYKKIG